MSFTITQDGKALTETQEGITMPADYGFATVNDYVHGVDRYFEELQWLALGMANHIEKIEKQRLSLLTICEELQESAEYWSEYFVPLGIVDRLDAAIASVKGGTNSEQISSLLVDGAKGGAA